MISLDTNQVLHKTPDGALLRMLHKVAEQTGHDLVLPEMVVEEYLAHYRRDIQDAAKQARDAIDRLRRLFPSWPGQAPSFGSVDEMAEKAAGTSSRRSSGPIRRRAGPGRKQCSARPVAVRLRRHLGRILVAEPGTWRSG